MGDHVHICISIPPKYAVSNVVDKARELGIDLLFLPPYSPNSNWIERLWKFTKSNVFTIAIPNPLVNSVKLRAGATSRASTRAAGKVPSMALDSGICLPE